MTTPGQGTDLADSLPRTRSGGLGPLQASTIPDIHVYVEREEAAAPREPSGLMVGSGGELYLNVNLDTGDVVVVEIIKFRGRKPFLGGYRHASHPTDTLGTKLLSLPCKWHKIRFNHLRSAAPAGQEAYLRTWADHEQTYVYALRVSHRPRRHKKNGLEYHHASTQSEREPPKPKPLRFVRDTQTARTP